MKWGANGGRANGGGANGGGANGGRGVTYPLHQYTGRNQMESKISDSSTCLNPESWPRIWFHSWTIYLQTINPVIS